MVQKSISIKTFDSLNESLQQVESRIRTRAFERFVERGKGVGKDLDDWLSATSDILRQPSMTLSETETQIVVSLSITTEELADLEVQTTHGEMLILGAPKPSTRQLFKLVRFPRPIDQFSIRSEFSSGTLRLIATTAEASYALHAKTA